VKELITILNQLVRFLCGALLAFFDSRFFLWIPKPHFGRYGGWYSSLRTLVFKGIDLLIISQKKIQDVLSETSCGCIGHDSLLERSQIHQWIHSEILKEKTKMYRSLPLGSKILPLKYFFSKTKTQKRPAVCQSPMSHHWLNEARYQYTRFDDSGAFFWLWNFVGNYVISSLALLTPWTSMLQQKDVSENCISIDIHIYVIKNIMSNIQYWRYRKYIHNNNTHKHISNSLIIYLYAIYHNL